MDAVGTWIKLLLTVVLVALVVIAGAITRNWPPMLDAPGPLTRLVTYLTTNTVETRADAARPELRPRLYAAAPEATWKAAQEAIRQLDWEILSIEHDSHSIHAVALTPLLRFQDDTYIQVRAADPDLSTVYFRSSSRIGRCDLAMNTRHLLDFREALEQELPR